MTKSKTLSDFPTNEIQPIAVLFKSERGTLVAVVADSIREQYSGYRLEQVISAMFNLGSDSFDIANYHYFGYSTCEEFYFCANADCAFPPTFVCDADNIGDAVDTFATECEHLVAINDTDLADYGEDYSMNDNGNAVDIEQVVCSKLTLLRTVYNYDFSE